MKTDEPVPDCTFFNKLKHILIKFVMVYLICDLIAIQKCVTCIQKCNFAIKYFSLKTIPLNIALKLLKLK